VTFDEVGGLGMTNAIYKPCIYYSKIHSNFPVYAKVYAWLSVKEFEVAHGEKSPEVARIVDIAKRYTLGDKLQDSEMPPAFCAQPHKRIAKLPEAFYANGYIVVQEKCAEVFRQFDLGENSLVPKKIYQNDRTTPVEGQFYILNFGTVKDTLIPEKSTSLTGPINHASGTMWRFPLKTADDQVVLSSKALEGPDMWHEKSMFEAIFFSERLWRALEKAKLTKPFMGFRCQIAGAQAALATHGEMSIKLRQYESLDLR
jgi:hypothetical protein